VTISNGYITLVQIKADGALGISDSTNDTELEQVIESVSREIDNFCNQYFYKSASPEVRYFTPTYEDQCYVSPLVSVSSLSTDTNLDRTYADTWTTDDYDLYPYNAASGTEAEPYWRIDRVRNSELSFVKGEPKYVKVTGVFGWAAVPQAVQQACLLWSMRTWMRHKTVLGVSAVTALGQMIVKVPPPDPDVQQLLSNYKLVITGVI
jgi:hypothetical protein